MTTTATGLLATPRLEARKKRLGEVHTARDTFGTHMMQISTACGLLQNTSLPGTDDPA